MFEDMVELAENKLILLYIINKIKYPISNVQITQIILENNFMNYFILQQYISELLSSDFLVTNEIDNKQRITITEKGTKVLTLFQNRISSYKLELIDEYLKKRSEEIKKEITVAADYTLDNNNSFIVNLIASENNMTLIDIKINVASNKQARDLCNKWKNNSSELYNKIIRLLTDN